MTKIALRNGSPFASPRFSHFFGPDFDTFFNEGNKGTAPAVNVKETKDAYQIEVSAPGFNKDSFAINVEDTLLTISGEVKENKLEEGEKFTRKEFVHSSFSRSFTLPKTIVADKIAAAYENGILNITLPKMEEAKSKGKIDIKIS